MEARNMTFAALAQHCKETRYCEAFYDEQGRKLYGVREPKKFASNNQSTRELIEPSKADCQHG
jgi:hypothetical protein